MVSSFSSGMPIPVSETLKWTKTPSSTSVTFLARTVISPRSVNFMALDSRLDSICLSRVESPITRGGRSNDMSLRSSSPFSEAARAGVAGLIVPDIPPEEKSERYFEGAREAGLHPIVLVSPNVSEKRLSELKPFASGLVYATARVGTTGASSDIEERSLREFLGRVKAEFELPVALGFGIGERKQIEALRGIAEVAVVGTRLLRTLKEEGLEALYKQVRNLAGENRKK